MRTVASRPRTKLPWIIGGAVVAAALVVGAVLWYGNQPALGEPGPTDAPSSAPTAGTDAAPTGCLGGASRDAAMVLAAQDAAPHTTNGAADFAASFTRWIQRFPYPSDADAAEASEGVLAEGAFTDDLAAYFASSPDFSGGIVPAGTTYTMSTIPGVWNLESATADQAKVTIGTAFIIDGALSSTLRSSITVTVIWDDGRWKIGEAAETRTVQELFAVGTPFTGGC